MSEIPVRMMTNEERRHYLGWARVSAVTFAETAVAIGRSAPEDEDPCELFQAVQMANMFANVAQALVVGENIAADGVEEIPS